MYHELNQQKTLALYNISVRTHKSEKSFENMETDRRIRTGKNNIYILPSSITIFYYI
jgi:hypothetical protein